MGTRNLTIVIQNEETKVAQYGQWDGYPEGHGLGLLAFLDDESNIKKLVECLPKIRFQNEEDHEKLKEFLKSIGSENGWLNLEQVKLYKKQYPFLDRDLGGDILKKIITYKDDSDIIFANSYEFAKDSLFCEWAYVIDFDKNSFEVYKGLNTLGISEEDRFFSLYDGNSDYYPVKIKQCFPLDNLPDEDEFVPLCKKP